jgi:hypothetical protein
MFCDLMVGILAQSYVKKIAHSNLQFVALRVIDSHYIAWAATWTIVESSFNWWRR